MFIISYIVAFHLNYQETTVHIREVSHQENELE